MKSAKAGRPLSLKRASKAERQAGDDLWAECARQVLKEEMAKREWGYKELSEALAVKSGVDLSAPVLNRRINRGTFSAAFLLMCLDALGRSLRASKSPIEDVTADWGMKKRRF